MPISHTWLKASSHLLVHKLPRVFLHVALAQIGGHVHQANFGEAKVCEFDVAHGCDQQAVGQEMQNDKKGKIPFSSRVCQEHLLATAEIKCFRTCLV